MRSIRNSLIFIALLILAFGFVSGASSGGPIVPIGSSPLQPFTIDISALIDPDICVIDGQPVINAYDDQRVIFIYLNKQGDTVMLDLGIDQSTMTWVIEEYNKIASGECRA